MKDTKFLMLDAYDGEDVQVLPANAPASGAGRDIVLKVQLSTGAEDPAPQEYVLRVVDGVLTLVRIDNCNGGFEHNWKWAAERGGGNFCTRCGAES